MSKLTATPVEQIGVHATPMSPDDQLRDALYATRDIAHAHHQAAGQLLDIARAGCEPAPIKAVRLTQAANWSTDKVGDGLVAESIGLINPSAVVVYLGIYSGLSGLADPSQVEAIAVAPQSALVLPVRVGTLDIAAKTTDLVAGDVLVHLLRFRSVQALYAAKIA